MNNTRRWVGFDESLPELGKLVLTCAKDGTIGAAMRVRSAWRIEGHRLERFILCSFEDYDNEELGFWCDCVPVPPMDIADLP